MTILRCADMMDIGLLKTKCDEFMADESKLAKLDDETAMSVLDYVARASMVDNKTSIVGLIRRVALSGFEAVIRRGLHGSLPTKVRTPL